MKTVFRIVLAAALAVSAGLSSCRAKEDPWEGMYPFWGSRPSERACAIEHRYGGVTFPVFVIPGEKEWVFRQMEEWDCVPDTPNEVDDSVAKAHSQERYEVRRSRDLMDFAGTPYQAVRPSYILFDSGDCLIYLYDWYNMCTMDAVPPPAKTVEPRFER